jgi:hypothetical protein
VDESSLEQIYASFPKGFDAIQLLAIPDTNMEKRIYGYEFQVDTKLSGLESFQKMKILGGPAKPSTLQRVNLRLKQAGVKIMDQI